MENGPPKQLGAYRRLATVAAALYTLSLFLPAIRTGKGPNVWTGFECLLASLTAFPFGLFLHLSPWANLTFAAGWALLRRGRVSPSAALGVVSVTLAASYYLGTLTEPDPPDGGWVLVGYWTWIASMVLLLFAPLVSRANSVTTGPVPQRPSETSHRS